MRSCSICLSVPDWFHLAKCLPSSPMSSQMAKFLFKGWIIFYIHTFFIHSPMCRHLGWFHSLALVNTASKKKWGCRYLFEILISFLLDICSEVWLLSSSLFNFLGNFHTVFHNGYINLHSQNTAQVFLSRIHFDSVGNLDFSELTIYEREWRSDSQV